ncbi:MAG: hypothetical protein OS130_02340 [Thermodesulfobacteriota bacterium]|nr:MAG: hypothetical protein OS130_02340 [Thermodesulfobacteriota bacterium]
MHQHQSTPNLTAMAAKWPSEFVSRERVSEFSGGILHPRTLANLDSKGEGPKRIRIGRKVAYNVHDLCDWLAKRTQNIK